MTLALFACNERRELRIDHRLGELGLGESLLGRKRGHAASDWAGTATFALRQTTLSPRLNSTLRCETRPPAAATVAIAWQNQRRGTSVISVSDIVKLLDQVPIWKSVKALPARIVAMEAGLDALEAKPRTAPGRVCATCGEPAMRKTASRRDPVFGVMGGKIETWTCSACQATDEVSSDGR